MKRILTLMLTIAFVLSIPFTAFAGGLPEGESDNTPVEVISDLSNDNEASTRGPSTGSTPTVGKIYNLHSAASSNSYLNVWGGIDQDGTRVDMWAKDGSIEQKFKVVNGSVSGTFRLQAVCSSSGRVVDAYSPNRPIHRGQARISGFQTTHRLKTFLLLT